MKNIFISLILMLPLSIFAQKRHTISGYIYEKGSKESLLGVSVYVKEYETGTVSNSYGFYSVTLPARDSITVIYSYVGFISDTLVVPFTSNQNYNVELEQGIHLKEVTIRAEKTNSESVQMSSIKLSPVEVKKVPMLFGEKDLFKTLMLLPGVQAGTEGTSGMYVRGGGPDQNLVILDEATIYNANHLLGFFSVFNGDAIKSVELIKGGFPARYGGRLSSIIDINMKEGNKTEYHGEGGIGAIASHAMVEGPIVKDKSSFMVSARRTYMDVLLQPLIKISQPGFSTGYYFYDLNTKLNYDFGDKNKLYVSGYFGRDKFYMSSREKDYSSRAGLFWQNGTGSLRWNHLFSNRLFSNLSYIYSDYTMKIYMIEKMNFYKTSLDYHSGIQDHSLKYDLTFVLNPSHTFYMGAVFTYHQFTPSALILKDIDTSYNVSQGIKIHGFEYAVYVEDDINIKNVLKINPGVRLSMFSVRGQTYVSPEPRLSMSYNFLPNFAIKTSYAMMNQNIHLLSSSTIGLPTDLWIPSTNNIKPQQSQQVAMGLAYDWKKPDLSFSIEGYYKKMDRMIAYKEGSGFIFFDYIEDGSMPTSGELAWEKSLTTGQGWSYGVEFLVRRTAGKFTGWVGYTLSWTEQQFDELNFGNKFYARYDRRHDVSIVLMYSPNNWMNLSLTWVFATGNAITLPESIYTSETINDFLYDYMAAKYGIDNQYYADRLFDVHSYGSRNNVRMKPFHHLDVGIQFIRHHTKWKSIFEISVYNIYNQKNAFFYFIGYDYDEFENTYQAKLKQICIFPIIPSFSYNFQF